MGSLAPAPWPLESARRRPWRRDGWALCSLLPAPWPLAGSTAPPLPAPGRWGRPCSLAPRPEDALSAATELEGGGGAAAEGAAAEALAVT